MSRYIILILKMSIIFTSVVPVYANPSRLALVIGNADYRKLPLFNPANDARDVATVLTNLDFEVMLKININQKAMIRAMQEFGQRLQNGGVGVFYFSGHGIQADNLNYLLPLQTDIRSEADIEFEAVSANRILKYMEQANQRGVNIMILDACRNNPYKSYIKGSSNGLARMDSPAGSLIAYATAPNTVALGDNRVRNSIYTKHVLTLLRTMPQLSVTDLFIEVGAKVMEETDFDQVPWQSVSLNQRFCFARCDRANPTQPAPTPKTRVSSDELKNSTYSIRMYNRVVAQ